MVDVAVIIPALDAGHTVEATLRSVCRQLGSHRIEIVVVDAGSTDDTQDRVRKVARRDRRVRLLTEPGAGPGGARNAGLDVASAPWVTFLDSDDLWDVSYLASVEEFLRVAEAPEAIITSIVRTSDRGEVPQPPLRWRFGGTARLVDLDVNPGFIVPNVAGVFFRRDLLDRQELRFDRTLRWSEDFAFAARYLLLAERRRVGVVPRALYYYRSSAGGITATAWAEPGKYIEPFERAYLELVQAALHQRGRVPVWLQHALIYEIQWYLQADRAVLHPSSQLDDTVRTSAANAVVELARRALDPQTVDSWVAVPLGYTVRSLLRLLAEPNPSILPPITYRPRRLHHLRKVSYFYSGPAPRESVIIDGRPHDPAHAKHVHHTVFGRHVGSERILWVPPGTRVEVVIDGVQRHACPFAGEPRRPEMGVAVPLPRRRPVARVRRLLLARTPPRRWLDTGLRSAHEVQFLGLPRARLKRPTESVLPEGLWLFHDRDGAADDNAQHLYRQVRREHPRQPARFLLSARSTDWPRLRSAGFDLIDTGDTGAVAAVWRSCEIAFLSDLSSPAYQQAVQEGWVGQTGLVFLQHGVTLADQSRWLNPKRVDLMVTTTPEEHQSIVADGTSYVLTDYEVRRTGMPRHDALARALREHGERRDVVLLAPTWSAAAREELSTVSSRSAWETRGMRAWSDLARSELLGSALEEHGLVLRLFLHPLLAGSGPRLWETGGGVICPSVDQGLTTVLARTRVVVTDFSSLGAEATLAGAWGIRYVPVLDPGSETRRLGLGEVRWPGRWSQARDPEQVAEIIATWSADSSGPAPGSGQLPHPELLDGHAGTRLLSWVTAALRPEADAQKLTEG